MKPKLWFADTEEIYHYQSTHTTSEYQDPIYQKELKAKMTCTGNVLKRTVQKEGKYHTTKASMN